MSECMEDDYEKEMKRLNASKSLTEIFDGQIFRHRPHISTVFTLKISLIWYEQNRGGITVYKANYRNMTELRKNSLRYKIGR